MPGFLCTIGGQIKDRRFNINKNNTLINKSIYINDFYIEQRTVNKFINDKVFEENENYFVLIEGVILNSHELIKKYKTNQYFNTIIEMYNKIGIEFFKEFRGSFSGILYDKKLNRKVIYTNHIGDKQVFYYQAGNEYVFGSEINYIVDYYKINNIRYTLNKQAAYYLLTYGYMLEDNTLFNEIKKLIAGHYIIIENGKLEIVQYYKVDNTPNYDQSEIEIIENIDILFRQAIKRSFDKDLEYGYKHLVALSGGLDSRMTTWVANDMGYGKNIVNYTFSQSDYLDETIPKKITADLKHEWIFKSLDNGLFLQNIDEVVKICSGGALYYGLAHGKSCLDLVDKNQFGIIHTGQLGDVVIGTFYSSLDKDKRYSLTDGVYSKLITNKLNIKKIKYIYENEEIFKLYSRGFNGANQGLLVAQESMETYSPFYDIDVLEYCLQIPVEYRYHHTLYFKWMLSKYPKAAKYKWEKLNGKITDKQITISGKTILLKHLPKRILRYTINKIYKLQGPQNTKNHMNPLDYWYNTNKELKQFMDEYYYSNINRIDFDDELKKDCEYLYTQGNIEKNQVLTLLAVMKLYFGESK